MKYDKLLLILLATIFCLYSANAVTELTSCGKNSGWIENETYILNFTDILSSYSNSWCFRISGSVDNLTFKGLNQSINNEKGDLQFLRLDSTTDNGWDKKDYSIKDFNLTYINNAENTGQFIYSQKSGNVADVTSYLYNSTIENVKIFNTENFIFLTTTEGVDGGMYFSNITYKDIFVYSNSDIFIGLASSSLATREAQLLYNNFEDSVFVSNTGDWIGNEFDETIDRPIMIGTEFNNVIIKSGTVTSDYSSAGTPNTYEDSLLVGEVEPESLDYNIYNNLVGYKELFGYNWAGQANESYLSFDGSNERTLMLSNKDYGSPYTISTNDILDFSLEGAYINNFLPFTLNPNGQVDCSYFSSDKCDLTNNITGSLSGFYGRGMINVKSDTKINNVNFLQTLTGNEDNNANAISNDADVTYNNVLINDSIIYWNQKVASILLKSNNVEISGNTFNLIEDDTSINDTGYAIDIDATNIQSNKIHDNIFRSSTDPVSVNISVFGDNCDSTFYNNHLYNESIISKSCSNVNATPLIAYEHTDGQVYYYRVGNYYDNFSPNCTDSNDDGFCDDDYTSGAVTDTSPLSEYPFNYEDHLLTAEQVVDNKSIDINLVEPTDNESYTFSDPSTASIDFTFNHESDFPDLTCSYVIDGVNEADVANVAKDTNITRTFTGWDAREYTYRVECSNDVNESISEEISFTIYQDDGGDDDGTGDDGEDTGTGDVDQQFTDIFSGDTQESTQGILGMFSRLNTPLQYLSIIAGILIFVAVLSVLFAIIMLIFK